MFQQVARSPARVECTYSKYFATDRLVTGLNMYILDMPDWLPGRVYLLTRCSDGLPGPLARVHLFKILYNGSPGCQVASQTIYIYRNIPMGQWPNYIYLRNIPSGCQVARQRILSS